VLGILLYSQDRCTHQGNAFVEDSRDQSCAWTWFLRDHHPVSAEMDLPAYLAGESLANEENQVSPHYTAVSQNSELADNV